MTSFVNIDYPTQHPGVQRLEAALESAQQLKQSAASPRTLATLLLSAMAAAAMVVAYQVMDSLAEGHLVALWMGLWMVAFATLAAFAGTARRAVASAQSGLDAWSRNVAAKRSDERLWATAQADPRVMADLQGALARADAYIAPNAAPKVVIRKLAAAKVSAPVAVAVAAKPLDSDWINNTALAMVGLQAKLERNSKPVANMQAAQIAAAPVAARIVAVAKPFDTDWINRAALRYGQSVPRV